MWTYLRVLLLAVVAFASVAAVETIYPDEKKVYNLDDAKWGAVADAVVATNCSPDRASSPTICGTPGTGTDNSAAFALAVDAAAALGGGELHFPCTSDGCDYRGAFEVDEDNIQVTCAPGVRLMPVAADTNGGQIMRFLISGDYVDKGAVEGCWLFDDDPAGHGHALYAYATVDNPTAGDSGTNDAAIDYNAPLLTTGAGLDDITIGGTFDGGSIEIKASTQEGIRFEFEIVAAATPDTFRWRRNQGRWATTQNVSTSAIELIDGITVLWAANTGHDASDVWTTWQTTEAQTQITSNAHGMTGGETIEITGAVPTAYNDTYIIGYVGANDFTIRKSFETLTTPGAWEEVPGIGEDVSWADPGGQCSGACGGTVVRYDEANDLLFIREDDSDNWSNGDTVIKVGGDWSVANTADIVNETAGNMDGLIFDGCRDCKVLHSRLENIGGVSHEIGGVTNEAFSTLNALVAGSDYRECPSIPSKDACIDLRQSDGAKLIANDFDCGVMGGAANQWCITLATSGSATVAPSNTTLLANKIYDSSSAAPHGSVDVIDGGIIMQPNATGVPFDTIDISGGSIVIDHLHLDSRVSGAAVGSLFIGASGSPILNLKVSDIKLVGPIALAGHSDSTMQFSDFAVSARYGQCLNVSAARGKFGPGVLEDCPLRAVGISSTTGELEFTGIDIIDTGTGSTSNSDDAHIQLPSSFTGVFKWSGGNVEGGESDTQTLAGFDCKDAPESYLSDIRIKSTQGTGVVGCQHTNGGYLELVNKGFKIDAQTSSTRGVTVQTPCNTACSSHQPCFDLNADDAVLADNFCYSDNAAAVTEDGDAISCHGNISADADKSTGGGTWTCNGTGSIDADNIVK